MNSLFDGPHKAVIGVVHLPPLPGSPKWAGDFEALLRFSVADAQSYEKGGAKAIFIENFGDAPFTKGRVGAETVAAMTAAACAIRRETSIPLGINVLRNDALSALAIAAACGANFIRVNVHTGAMVTDQGLIEGNAYETLRYRQTICPGVAIYADVHVKHALPLADFPLEDSARDTVERGHADAVIVSGSGTGVAADLSDLVKVRRACPQAKILLGSGVTEQNLSTFLPLADGFIVGTSLKRDGKLSEPVDADRVRSLVAVAGRGK